MMEKNVQSQQASFTGKQGMSYLSLLYLLLAVLGLSAFVLVNIGIREYGGFNVKDFVSSTWINDWYARSISADFIVVALTAIAFMIIEGMRVRMKYIWLFVIMSFLIAIAFAFPLFLFFRERKLRSGRTV
ncbi:DUF2834 domain-containing protein [Porphyromonas pogonae]|uniref:DUF2834 domain-containing protein n=1 Tax=Porphyromonas pogonae TaxID=867595 RepID=UPI002E777F53|nr:DUF2834 domain-containing protein [Porphyromonas pogonae]